MTVTLYIAEDCHQFARASGWVRDNTEVSIFNVDHDKTKSPIPIFIFPALFQDEGAKSLWRGYHSGPEEKS